MSALSHPDGLARCPWPKDDPLYLAYHDEEWGVPEWDDRALYEKLVLDGFQAGLSWITILRKRENFRRAFDGFDPETIARYGKRKTAALMQDAGIVRNRAKIEGAVALGARLARRDGKRSRLFPTAVGLRRRPPADQPFPARPAQVPAETAISRAMSKELSARGFKFCGPTIVYAFMQAVGMVNDHLLTCHRHAACAASSENANDRRRAPQSDRAEVAARVRRAPGSACCRAAGSTCSIPRRSTSRSRTSPTASPAWRAGTARRRDRTSSRSPSTRCWSRRSAGRRAGHVDRRLGLALLLHDAPEYVIGDMISPFKAVIGDAYKAVEKRLLDGDPSALRPAGGAAGRRRPADQGGGPGVRLSRSDPARRLLDQPRRGASSAARRPCRARSSATTSRRGRPRRAEKRYLERFDKLAAL